MALIKWSGMISEVKGKLNGTIFSNPKYGAQMRNRKGLKGQESSVWGTRKSKLSHIASQWKALDDTQRNSFALQVANYPYVNKFGDTVTPSAYQLFCTLNLNLLTISSTQISTCLPPNPEYDYSPVELSVNVGGTLEFTYTSPGDNTVYAVYYISPPVSQGVYYVPRKMRLLTFVRGDIASPYNVDSLIEALYGPIQNGQKYFWRMQVIDKNTGQRYGSYNGSLVVSGHV